MGVEIRPAEVVDIEGVQAVAEEAWHAAHAPIIGKEAADRFLARFYDGEAFESLLEREETVFEVAVSADNLVVGFVSATPDDHTSTTYQLGRLYVTPDRWGHGIGGRLLDRAEARIRERGGKQVALGVMAANEQAVGFYEAAGYRRTDSFYDDRIDTNGYTYEKSL